MAKDNLTPISLNEIEISDLKRQDPWFEIKNRYTDLAISLPSTIDKNKPKDSDYFLAKSFLAIRSALSRLFKSHSDQQVSAYTAQQKDVFDHANEKGKALFEKIDNSANLILKDMSPRIGSLETNLASLNTMHQESKRLVDIASSIKDRQAIQEKTEQRVQEIAPEKGLT